MIRQQTRLILTGGLTVVAGAHMHPDPGRATVIGVGAVLLVVALYREIIALAAEPVVVVRTPDPTPPYTRRDGLGPQNGSQPRKDD